MKDPVDVVFGLIMVLLVLVLFDVTVFARFEYSAVEVVDTHTSDNGFARDHHTLIYQSNGVVGMCPISLSDTYILEPGDMVGIIHRFGGITGISSLGDCELNSGIVKDNNNA